MKRSSILLMVAFALSVTALASWAQPGPHGGRGHGEFMQWRMEKLMDEVDATEAQREIWLRIVEEERGIVRAQRQAVREQMRQVWQASPDEPGYLEQVQRASEASAEAARAAVQHMGQLRYRLYTEVGLSDEQKARLQALKEKMHERGRPHRRHFEPTEQDT